MPGVEPGSQAWGACMIPLHYMRFGSVDITASVTHGFSYCYRLRTVAQRSHVDASFREFALFLFAQRLRHWAHGVVVSHPLRMRKALGSNPSVSMFFFRGKNDYARTRFVTACCARAMFLSSRHSMTSSVARWTRKASAYAAIQSG